MYKKNENASEYRMTVIGRRSFLKKFLWNAVVLGTIAEGSLVDLAGKFVTLPEYQDSEEKIKTKMTAEGDIGDLIKLFFLTEVLINYGEGHARTHGIRDYAKRLGYPEALADLINFRNSPFAQVLDENNKVLTWLEKERRGDEYFNHVDRAIAYQKLVLERIAEEKNKPNS